MAAGRGNLGGQDPLATRVDQLETKRPISAPQSANFTARGGQTYVLESPPGGMTVTLVEPATSSRNDQAIFVNRTKNPVRFTCINGLVNQVNLVTTATVGLTIFTCDGDIGWFNTPALGGLPDGVYGDITITGGGTVLNITAGVIVDADVNAAAAIAISKLANAAGNTITGNWTASSAAHTDNAVGTNTVVGRVAGNIVAAPLVNAQIDAAAAIALSKLATQAATTFVANLTAGIAVPTAITGTQATTMLDVFTSLLKGLVPASGGGTTNFLRADGTWAAAGGSGLTQDQVLNLVAFRA